MRLPIHIRDQREAALRDVMVAGLAQTKAKLMVAFVVHGDFTAASISALCLDACADESEVKTGSTIGRTLADQLLKLYAGLNMEAGTAEAQQPQAPMAWLNKTAEKLTRAPIDTVLVADAVEAIVRNCLRTGCLSASGRFNEQEVLGRVRSLAGLAVNEQWRQRQA